MSNEQNMFTVYMLENTRNIKQEGHDGPKSFTKNDLVKVYSLCPISFFKPNI